MNSLQTSQKLEQFRREAAINSAIKPMRQEHLKTLYGALRILILELRALTIGNLELAGKTQVQNHV